MNVDELVFALIFMGLLAVPTFVYKQWGLFSCFVSYFIVFGIVEWIAVAKTGKSVSQLFWAFSLQNKKGAIIILVSMLVAWLTLIYHLASKMLKGIN